MRRGWEWSTFPDDTGEADAERSGNLLTRLVFVGGEFMPDTIFYHLKLKMGKASAGGL